MVVANKADLLDPGRTGADRPHPADRLRLGAEAGGLAVSARDALADPAALDALRRAILDAAQAGGLDAAAAGLVAVNERHRVHLDAARAAVGRATASLGRGDGGDTLALDLRDALHHLGMVTGAVTTEHVLDAVFSQFCIGK